VGARDEAEATGSRRTCVVTGFEGEPEAMLRFALSPEGVVTPDILRKLPGRGVWTQLDREAVRKAAAKGGFARGFRKPVRVDPDLQDLVDRLLAEDALRFLSLVNKAGLVVTGAAKVEAAIRAGPLAGLISACDGSADGVAKLDRRLVGTLRERAADVTRVNLFAASQLDLALGRSNVIHAALNAGPASAAFLAKVARLHQYRSGEARVPSIAIDGGEGFATSTDL
jgi:uncharacterized protein